MAMSTCSFRARREGVVARALQPTIAMVATAKKGNTLKQNFIDLAEFFVRRNITQLYWQTRSFGYGIRPFLTAASISLAKVNMLRFGGGSRELLG